MPILTRNGTQIWRRRDPGTQLVHWLGWLLGTAVFLYCWRMVGENTNWDFIWDAPKQALDLASRMVPPKWGYTTRILRPLWDTLTIATLGTVLALFIATPVAFLAARNTTPLRWLTRPAALLIIVSSRSINSLIWALLLVLIIGPGMLAGILAIAFRSIGFIGKLLYEAIEEIDPKQVEAVTSTGANRGQVLVYGIVPQILPAFAGISVYRWDINIRESTVVGLVGAGGIGLQLQASVNILAWNQVTVIFLAILATVVLSETASAALRKRFI
ncbi:MAG: phosphonate ABC transporter, permease protein PhnE [Deltaproteobacteria bacterium]|nr:phosphonate ABC transporter, permease protein PhnE [Deltaproteobacteria bacterium]